MRNRLLALAGVLLVVAGPAAAFAQTPGAPSGLAVTVTADNRLQLEWTAPVTGGTPTGYIVQVGTSSGTSGVLSAEIGNVTSYTTAAMASGATLFVRVRAMNASGISAASNEVTVVTNCLAPVTGAQMVSWRPTTGGVQVLWSASQDLTWTVEAGTAPGLADAFTGAPADQLKRAIDLTLAAGTYYVRVKGAVACGAQVPVSSEIVVVSGEALGTSPVLINEFDGFVELKNVSSSSMNIGGSYLLAAVGLDKRVTSAAVIPANTVLGAGCTYLLGPASMTPAPDLALAASGRSYALVNASGRVLDSVARRDQNNEPPFTPLGEGTLLPDLPALASFARVADQDTNSNVADFIILQTPTPQNSSACSGTTPPPGPTAPGAPSNLTSSVNVSTVTLNWTAPATGGAPVTYRIEAGSAPGTSNLGSFDFAASLQAVVFSGVGNGTYYVRVRAMNAAGISAASNEVVITVCGPGCVALPGGPQNLQVTVSGSTVVLTWSRPVTGGAAESYVLEAGSAAGLADLAAFPTRDTFVVVGGVARGTYYVRVRALNAGGSGPVSTEVVVIVP